MKRLLVFTFLGLCSIALRAQAVPSSDENIPFLITFGKQSEVDWGDDDFSQTFFFLIPETYKGMVYIRIFDADTGGKNDEINGVWDSKMLYSLYGGKQAFSGPDAQGLDPKGNYKSGNLLISRVIGENPKFDDQWMTLGPFNPTEGEYIADYKGYIFKLICDGVSGDDGNLYRHFLSTSGKENIPIEGGNAFSYEYTFRLWDDPKQVSHIYPFVDDKTIKVRQSNFDWDDDGKIRVSSEVRREQLCPISGDGVSVQSEFAIMPGEKGKSLNFEFIKRPSPLVKNNNVVVSIQNQYGQNMPFFSTPIGGVPRYKYRIQGKKVSPTKK